MPGQVQIPGMPVVPGQMQPAYPQQSSQFTPRAPKGPTQLIDLPRMDNRAIGDLITALITRFELESGYSAASAAQDKLLPVPAKVIAIGPELARGDAGKKMRLIRFGFLRQPGQLPQLWVSGMVAPDAATPNPDAALVGPAIAEIIASREKNQAELPITELKSQVINLAYIDADSAVGMLKSMGFNTTGVDRPLQATQAGGFAGNMGLPYGQQVPGFGGVVQGQQPGYGWWGAQQTFGGSAQAPGPRNIRNAELPIVIRMPGPNPQDVGLVGAAPDGSTAAPGTGQNGATTILGAITRLSTETLSSPTTQLMVLYNPDRPEQLALVRKAVAESIDTPARQIVIEAMVLEVTSSGLNELGVQWGLQKGLNTLTLGSLTPGSGVDTVSFNRDSSIAQMMKTFFVKVQALVQDGKAEVLARPSVLTLDNRQATIRVGTDIPIATSRDASSPTDAHVSYSFFYLPTGIQLNVRPRIDNEGNEVSLQIDAAVSSTVASSGAQIKSPGDVVLAAAPAVSTRRVQTYARIPNGTPLIIGGLISRTKDEATDATPVLGELPLLGALFRGTKKTSARDEVIIVLTPYVLEPGRTGLEAAMPKDAPAFEYSRDNALFRKNVRLRAEDTLNTAYIRENARLVTYRKLVNRIFAKDSSRVENTPLDSVLGDKVPGERSLMTGMLYKVVNDHYDGEPVTPERMQLFNQRDQGEVVVNTLAGVLARYGDGRTPESFFRKNPGKCLAITFAQHRKDVEGSSVLEEPEPTTRMVDCKPDRSDWSTKLLELNRPTNGQQYSTILIQDRSDLVTLSNAITLRRLIQINGGVGLLDFDHLGIGRVLSMPEFARHQNHLLEADVARYFFLAQHYYLAFENDFESAMAAVDKTLRSGKYNDLVGADELPGPEPLRAPKP